MNEGTEGGGRDGCGGWCGRVTADVPQGSCADHMHVLVLRVLPSRNARLELIAYMQLRLEGECARVESVL